MKKSILEYAKQILLIVFSVVLGILVSEKIEERKNDQEAMVLFSKIKSEINDNWQLIEYWAPYHNEIANKLDSLEHDEAFIQQFIDDEAALYSEVLTRGNMMDRMPSDDAWDIAKSHPLIVHFDYEALLIISKIYTQQQLTFEPVSKVSDLFYSADFNAVGSAKQNLQDLKIVMREIVSREIQLLSYFRESEKVLELQEN